MKDNIFVADLETTCYEGQEFTEVWLGGILSLDYKKKRIVYSMDEFMNLVFTLPHNALIFFHNLKFDGSFLLDWLERHNFSASLKPGTYNGKKAVRFKKTDEMFSREYSAFISSRGLWYNIIVKKGRNIYTFRDSLKLLPFSLDKITQDFDVEHKKLTMEYTKYRESGCDVSPEEMEYFEHDLYGLAECLNIMIDLGFDGFTIGSCCLKYFRELYGKFEFSVDFPNVYSVFLPSNFGSQNVGEYILKSYYGGFVYVNPEKKEKIVKNGHTLDVTSLYASVMHSKSGISYPIGMPCFGTGYYMDHITNPNNKYVFQRFRCSFRLKPGKLPFIRAKNTYLYNSRECLTTSDITYHDYVIEHPLTLTLTQSELGLFLDHYDVYGLEYLDYVYFYSVCGIFDEYVNIWYNKKKTAKSKVERTISKLMLVNLYGKFCSKLDSSFKVPYFNDEKDCISFYEEEAMENIPGYIPIGSAIVSEARVWHIKHCQIAHDQGIFDYSDTDSMHIDGEIPDGIPIADDELLTYKIESSWAEAWFQHPKRYIEKINDNSQKGYHYSVTCAGLPDRGKELLRCSMGDFDVKSLGNLTELEYEFLTVKRDVTSFSRGIKIPGKKRLRRIKGGVVLNETCFTIL